VFPNDIDPPKDAERMGQPLHPAFHSGHARRSQRAGEPTCCTPCTNTVEMPEVVTSTVP
jgi:hypothetical protein